MTKVTSFEYTDTKGKKSRRTLLVLQNPTDKYFGIDMSELDVEEQVLFSQEYSRIHQEYKDKLEQLQIEYDLKYKLRQFFADKMENQVTEDIA